MAKKKWNTRKVFQAITLLFAIALLWLPIFSNHNTSMIVASTIVAINAVLEIV